MAPRLVLTLPALCAALFAVPAHAHPPQAQTAPPTRQNDPQDIAAIAGRVDLTSFPNSIGPRREPGKYSLADYGFTHMRRDGNAVEFEPADRSWVLRFTLLYRGGDGVQLCILDRARNGGSYFTVRPVEFRMSSDGLYRATGREIRSPSCM